MSELVFLCDLPYDVRGFIKTNDDGNYVYVLNARLTREVNRQTFLHEKQHCEHSDLHNNVNVQKIELERHSKY